VVASGTNYRPAQLKAQVVQVLSRFPRASARGAKGTTTEPAPEALSPSAVPASVTACVAQVAGNQRPRLVDVAHYEGRLATVIVVPIPGANTLRVVVAGPRCSAGMTDLLASTTVPAPG
jgi:hypothetical protein